MSDETYDAFAVYAEADGVSQPLILTHLTFARLMDDVIVPYQSDLPFFIDGVPVKREKLKRIKVIQERPFFKTTLGELLHGMRFGAAKVQELYANQYHVRVEALLRESGDDVTSQVIKAFDSTIRPKLLDYLPKREELISAAFQVFLQGLKVLGSG